MGSEDNVEFLRAEAAFRIHQTDRQWRPVWQQRQDRVEAPILVCFPAYVWWKALAATGKQVGLGEEPRQVFQALAEIALVDVVLPTRHGITIRKRCVRKPTEHQAILLQHLGLALPPALQTAAL